MVRRALPLLLVFALWTATPAHAQSSGLLVASTPDETEISVGASAGVARVEISVPAQFALNVTRPVGAVVGRASVDLASAAAPGGDGSTTDGDLVVADPSRYASNPKLQACSSGPHAAVWRVEPLDLPVFVDAASGPDAALGGYVLRVCFDLPAGLSFRDLSLDLMHTVGVPAVPGIYIWHALITPMTATGALDETATWEVRALVPWPTVLTLHARHGKSKGRYVLYGRLTLAGKPRGGATIRILPVFPPTGTTTILIGFSSPKAAETNRTGRFSKAVRVKRRTQFFALWFPFPRDGCSAPSTAPGGCQSETTSPALSRPVLVRP